MANLNPRQFQQPAFRGFGDQAMRSHRAAPTPQPGAAPAAQSPAQGQQMSLFQADEVRNPQGPPPPTFNANQFRASQHALPGMSTRSVASQRVTPTPQPEAPAPAPSRSNWVQPELPMLGPTPSSPHSPSAAGPTPTRWPSAPASGPDLPGGSMHVAPRPTGPPSSGRTVTINGAAYRAAGQNFGPAPAPAPAPSSVRSAPAAPPAPSAPPAPAPARPQVPSWVGRAGRMGGLAVGLGARAFESVNRAATDPARSGNPLFKTSQGWNKA